MDLASLIKNTPDLEERQKILLQEFSVLADWEEKYKKIIDLGKSWPALPEAEKNEDLLVKGCQSQVWLKADLVGDKIVFRGDSDALIVKGLLALVLTVYSDAKPSVILKTDPHFLQDLGLQSHLSPSRSNGLFSMIKQIKYYATAFSYLVGR